MKMTRGRKQQKFGFSSTAEDVAYGHDLTGKVALVTGGNSGLGLETCRVLSLHGCRVYFTARKASQAEEAIKKMKEQNLKSISKGEQLPAEGDISFVLMDLADLDSVKNAAAEFLQQSSVVDYLILNAGIMATPYTKTKHNMESQIGTNHFGHFALTRQLLAGLSTPPSRIVAVSSVGHKMGSVLPNDLHYTKGRTYEPWEAYGQSKLANVLFAKELNSRGNGDYIAVSLHPGGIMTNLMRHQSRAMRTVFPIITRVPGVLYMAFGERRLKTVGEGTATTLWATLKDGVEGGEYCADCSVVKPFGS